MYNSNGRSAPLLICDVCGYTIDDVSDGAAVFAHVSGEGTATPVMHVHKKTCHDKADEVIGSDASPRWDELSVHLLNLAHNVGMSVEKLAALAERRDQCDL